MSAAASSRAQVGAEPAALRSVLGGILLVLIGLVGAALSASALVDRAADGGCQLGLPAAAVAFGIDSSVALLAVLALLRVGLFGGLMPLALLGLTFGRALFALADGLGLVACPASPTLDVIALVEVVAAALFVLPGLRSRGWREALLRRPASRVEAPFVALALAIGSGGVAAIAYQAARGDVVVADTTRPALLDLPAAGVAFGAASPEVVAAYFVDVDSAPCRDEFRALTAALRQPQLASALQLRLYHAPQVEGGCFQDDGPQASLRDDPQASPCVSAAAIECVELLAPGAGIRMAGELFDRRRGAAAPLDPATIVDAARALGLHVDADQPGDPLLRCIQSNRAIHRRIAAHAEFAAKHGAAELPHGFFVGVDGERLDASRVEAFRGRLSPALRERKITSVRGEPSGAASETEVERR